MATRRRIEIKVETEQVVVRREDANFSAWCDGCHCYVLMIGVEQAARLSGLSWREMVRKTDAGELHYCEPAGGLLICLASLSQWLRRSNQPTLLLPPINLTMWEAK